MKYDEYYQQEQLFGEPYPELISFFKTHPERGKLLDFGCGQGRDAIPLARLGYEVTGVDNSKVGIAQMNKIAQAEKLNLMGIVADIYQYDDFSNFDFILLDSLFHFLKADREKETDFIKKMISHAKPGTIINFCIQHTGHKVAVLNQVIDSNKILKRLQETDLQYIYKDDQTGHSSTTDYKMIVIIT